MRVLVTGATGTVGSHVVRTLAARGVPVRAFARDLGKAEALLGADVDTAVGDFSDRDSIDRALAGADRVFLACGNTPDQVDHERAVIDAAAAAGVERLVKLSGPWAAIDAEHVFARWHGEIERHLLAAGPPWVLLRPRTYLTNLLAFAGTVAQTGMLFAPARTARISFVDPRDVAEAAAVALVDDGHHGQVHTLTGPQAITYGRIAEALTEATGRPVTYVDVPEDAARRSMLEAGLPAPIAEAILGIFASQRAGTMADTTDTLRMLLGREPRTVDDFARDHAPFFSPRAADHVSVP